MSNEEVWQGYTEDGEPTNTPLQLTEAAKGALHGSVHVWVWRRSAATVEVLLQKRALTERTWPGYWDVSAAGHIDFGEQPITAAIRETAEEIGLEVPKSDLVLLFEYRENAATIATIPTIENEFQFVYGFEVDGTVKYTSQSDEVAAVQWVTLEQLEILASGDQPTMQLVRHSPSYFVKLLEKLRHVTGS